MKGWTADEVAKLGKEKQSSRNQENGKRTAYDFIIGIDPGVNTGIAIWNNKDKKLIEVVTVKIHEAMDIVFGYSGIISVIVRFEDARQRKWFGKSGREQLQGAGSIKRDCQIWEDFMKHHEIKFEAVPPKNNKTKLSSEYFKKITGWTGRTNEHGRDAAMLVVGYH